MLRLVEACQKRAGPAGDIPSPPATEIKDQIWRAIAKRWEIGCAHCGPELQSI
jgi:phage terminase large subunit GpA-like protein